MPNRNRLFFMFFLMLGVLAGCSTMSSRMVRHSDPLSPDQHRQLGATYEAQELLELADQQYEAAIHLDKKYIPALIARGNLAFQNGGFKKAESFYRRVLRISPRHAGANNNLAMVYITRGKDLAKAEQHANRALEQGGPLRPYVLETMASLYIQQARLPEARKILDEADAVVSADNKALCEQLVKTREKLELNSRSQ